MFYNLLVAMCLRFVWWDLLVSNRTTIVLRCFPPNVLNKHRKKKRILRFVRHSVYIYVYIKTIIFYWIYVLLFFCIYIYICISADPTRVHQLLESSCSPVVFPRYWIQSRCVAPPCSYWFQQWLFVFVLMLNDLEFPVGFLSGCMLALLSCFLFPNRNYYESVLSLSGHYPRA